MAQVAAAWAGVSCTELCESVYGERVQTNDKSLEEEIEIEEEDEEEEEEDELFNFDEGSPPQPKIKNNQERGERKESSKESEVVPAPFLAYVLMYFAKVLLLFSSSFFFPSHSFKFLFLFYFTLLYFILFYSNYPLESGIHRLLEEGG